ncbi:MAG: GtrA family protein [Acidobacteriaceae bacterium]|nr:GtrA family protein [Acidobacteriaceae bacterium]
MISFREVARFVRFGLSGFPGFLVAIGSNVLLIERFHWPKPAAYLLVVWLQMTAGFVMCRIFVFSEFETPILTAYIQFALSMAAIRIADWTLYTCAVEILRIPYLVAQISTSGLFLGIKFISARAIFRNRPHIPSASRQ